MAITLGSGNDRLEGFGQASANGGSGSDTVVFAFTLADFQAGGGTVAVGNLSLREVDFSFGGETLSTEQFEAFCFADQVLNFNDLMLV